MNIIKNLFGPNKAQEQLINTLSNKVSELEQAISKSTPLNTALAGIIGANWVELETTKYDNAYNNNYVIYRGITLLANNLSQLPLEIYKGNTQLDGAFTFPNFDLQNPNPEMSLNEVLYNATTYYFYRGELFIYINLEPPRISLEPLNPKLMERNRDGSWKFNGKVNIPKEQMIYIKFLNPDGARGLSPVDVVKDELLSDVKAGEFQKKFFENFAQVGGTLTDELGMASVDDMRTLVNQFNQAHQGSNNAHKTLGLPKGIKYNEMAQTMKEMEFLSGRKDIRDKILAILGIHKSILGIADNITYQTQKDAMRMLWQLTLQPAAYRIQEKFNQQFFNIYFPGYQCFFDFSDVKELQESGTEKIAQAEGYKRLGYTMNEVNDLFDLGMEDINEPIGKMRFVPSGMILVDELIMPDEPEKVVPPEENLGKIVKIIEDYDSKVFRRSTHLQQFNKLQRSIEKKMAGKLGKFFSTELGKVLAIIKEKKSINKMDINILLSLIDNLLEEDKKELQAIMTPLYQEGALGGSGLAINSLGLSVPARVDDAIVGLMVNKIRNISNHTYNLIRNQIKEGIEAGESVSEMANRVIDVYKFNASRARTIAQTESSNVMNRSTDAEYKKAGVKNKVWISTKDDKTRDTHLACDKEGEIPYNQPFQANGLQYPGDPAGDASEVINCRCCIAGTM